MCKDKDPLDLFEEPYSEKDAGNVLNVIWLAMGLIAMCGVFYVMGWL